MPHGSIGFSVGAQEAHEGGATFTVGVGQQRNRWLSRPHHRRPPQPDMSACVAGHLSRGARLGGLGCLGRQLLGDPCLLSRSRHVRGLRLPVRRRIPHDVCDRNRNDQVTSTEILREQAAEAEARAAAKAAAEAAAHTAAEATARAAAEARAEAELAAAKARAHKTPVKHLSVKPVAHSRHSSADPGFTKLDITTSPYTFVTVKLSRYGHSTERFEWGSHSTEVAEVVRWSCRSPGGTYRYVVTAKSDVGRALIRRGRFVPVSVARCRALKKQEAEAKERSEREAAEEQRGAEREERERLATAEANCRAEGGTPITLYVEGRAERYCRAPWGGLLPVPH